MKTVNRVKLSMKVGICFSLFCLGSSQAGNQNIKPYNIQSLITASEDAFTKNPTVSINMKQEKNNLEKFIKNTISANFAPDIKNGESKFSYLSASNVFDNEDLFVNNETSYQKLKKINQMQKIAKHISKNYRVKPVLAEEIVLNAVIEAKKYDLPPELLLSVIRVESTFNPKAKSGAGAIGLTQVIPFWHKERVKKVGTVKDLQTVQGSIKVGADVLKHYLDRSKGNIRTALQRYNGSLNDKSYKYSDLVFKTMKKYETFFKDVEV